MLSMSIQRFTGVLTIAFATSCASPEPPVKQGWMAAIDDGRLLSELSIPGTHESAALHEPIPGTAKDQDLTLDQQLAAGIRYFDIRCRHLDDAFAIFHGPISELQDFDQVTATMLAFLDSHATETVVMSIKEESVPENATRTFEQTFATYVAKAPDRWVLGAAVPTLGDVRGKIVLLRRFPATSLPLGIDASMWADNTTFSIMTPDAVVRVQDAYKVSANAMKWSAITALLAEASTATAPTLFLNYTSGYQTKSGLPNTPSVAIEINTDLDTYLADPANAHAHLGVLAMDLVTDYRAAAVAKTNAP